LNHQSNDLGVKMAQMLRLENDVAGWHKRSPEWIVVIGELAPGIGEHKLCLLTIWSSYHFFPNGSKKYRRFLGRAWKKPRRLCFSGTPLKNKHKPPIIERQ
jgi:hypothetical protein